ncbi:hypothetical protein [Serratia ureilytica]|uniref:hypothetical protein n=1 Tax=Serratia ureilytica TaxID=300181 RepID=UPI00313AE45D
MDKFNYLKEQLTAALATWQQTNGGKTTVGWMHAANPEVIAALLAELEDERASRAQWQQNCTRAEERIAELEEEFAFIMGQNDGMEKELRDKDARIEHLEAKLATPVRLPDIRFIKVGETAVAVMHATSVKEQIQHAGFKVEGDE